MLIKLLSEAVVEYPGDMDRCMEVLAHMPANARERVRGFHFDDATMLSSANVRMLSSSFPNMTKFSVRDRNLVDFDFTALPSRLVYLAIRGCGIRELRRKDLAHLTQLTRLDVSNNHLTFIDPRALEQLPSLVDICIEDQFGPTPLSFESYDELEHNAEAIKADVRAMFAPRACRAAVIAFLVIQRRRLPAASRIHKDVVRYMVAPMLLDTGYDAEWRLIL